MGPALVPIEHWLEGLLSSTCQRETKMAKMKHRKVRQEVAPKKS
jgi:hypothetical protein